MMERHILKMKTKFTKNKLFVIIFTCFLVVVLFLTFFSKTIYYSRLPKVTVTVPGSGKLLNTVEGYSLADYLHTNLFFSRLAGYCKEIYVEEGELVTAGQLIMELETNADTINALELELLRKEQEIALLKLELKKEKELSPKNSLELSKQISQLETKLQELNNIKGSLEAGTYTSPELESYKLDITYAWMVHADVQKRCNEGAGSQAEMDAAIYAINTASLKHDSYVKSLKEENKKAIMDLEAQIATLQKEKTGSDHDTNHSKTEYAYLIEAAEKELDIIQKNLEYAKNTQILATTDGVIASINAVSGGYIEQNALLCQVAGNTRDYKVTLNVADDKIKYIVPGNEAVVEISGIKQTIKGIIQEIEAPSGGGNLYQVTIVLKDMAENPAGKQASITISHTSKEYSSIIPRAALKQDSNGYYVMAIRARDTILGEGYVAEKVYVDLVESDDSLCAISGMFVLEPVMLTSSKDVVNGQQVRYQ